MRPLEQAIADALAQARGAGRVPTSIYLSADDRETLGLEPGSVIQGLPVRAAARKSKVYCSHGESQSIARPAAPGSRLAKRRRAKPLGGAS